MNIENEKQQKQNAEWKAPQEQGAAKPEKIQKLFSHCFAISRFESNDYIPVGGHNVFSQEVNVGIKGDFENFDGVFGEANTLAEKYDLNQLGEWLRESNIDIDPKLFAILYAFTKVYEKHYPENAERAQARRKLYKEKGEVITLSDIFNGNAAQCAEIAAIAQYYLQNAGIDTKYISGDVLWSKEHEFSEPHSFLEIKDGEKTYLYDPTNPVNTTQGFSPSIYTTEVNFDDEINKGKKRFVTATNLIGHKEVYFGVNDGTDIEAARDIV